jgi:hypothetical protein
MDVKRLHVTRLMLGLFALLIFTMPIHAQQLIVEPVGKAPPALVPGGTQVAIYNQTAETQQLRVRPPGGNWILVTIPPNGGRNLRCMGCIGGLEAVLAGNRAQAVALSPGIDYEFQHSNTPGEVLVQPRGRRSDSR